MLKKLAISVTAAAVATVGAAGIAYADTASGTGHGGVQHRTSHTYPSTSTVDGDATEDDTDNDATATSYGEDGDDGASGDDSDDSGRGADGRDGESRTTYSLLGGAL